MTKKPSNLFVFGVFSFVLSFTVCFTLLALLIAPDSLTMIEYRRAVLREQWFWYAVFVCVTLTFIVRYMWPRLNPPDSEFSDNLNS